jgi:hypothetical protein
MKMVGGIFAIALSMLIALPGAQARPRLGPGVLMAPLAIIGGIAGAAVGSRKARAHRAYQYRQRLQRERAAIRRAKPDAPRQAVAAARPGEAAVAAGWAGPLFWPYAYDDIFNYAFARPGGEEVWSRGFGDALAGLFAAPSSDREVRRTALSEPGTNPAWDELCGSETPNAAQAMLQSIRETVKPTSAQQGALDELGAALSRAAARIEAACPERRPANATERLHMMIARLTAMRQAVLTVRAPLRAFYETLDDAQKAALDRGAAAAGTAEDAPAETNAAADCATPAAFPQRQLERLLQPTRTQRGEFERFYRTAIGFDRFVATTCPSGDAVPRTAPERLDAIKDRLAVLRYAATSLSPAYEQFYRSLSDAQRTRLGSRERTAETQR